MVPNISEPRFVPIVDRNGIRIGRYQNANGENVLEVMYRIAVPGQTLTSSLLALAAEKVQALEQLGLSMMLVEGSWAVGELRMPDEQVVKAVRNVLRV